MFASADTPCDSATANRPALAAVVSYPSPVVPLVQPPSANPCRAQFASSPAADAGTSHLPPAPGAIRVVVFTPVGRPYETSVYCCGNVGANSDAIVAPSGCTSPRYSPVGSNLKLVCNSPLSA